MKLNKIFSKSNIPYIVIISSCLITTIILLLVKEYYSSLYFFISSFPSFFTPFFFIYSKEKKDKFSSYLIKMIARILYLTLFSFGLGLIWIYVPIFKLNVHPALLLTFPFLSLAYYLIIVIKQIISSKNS